MNRRSWLKKIFGGAVAVAVAPAIMVIERLLPVGPTAPYQSPNGVILKLLEPWNRRAAEDSVNEFTRRKLREDSFLKRITLPKPIPNDLLDRSTSPASISIPFSHIPDHAVYGDSYNLATDGDGIYTSHILENNCRTGKHTGRIRYPSGPQEFYHPRELCSSQLTDPRDKSHFERVQASVAIGTWPPVRGKSSPMSVLTG